MPPWFPLPAPLLAAPDDVLRAFVQLVFLLFFIGIPILRTILEKRAKGERRDRTRERKGGREPARDRWRELLDGAGAGPLAGAEPPPAPELPASVFDEVAAPVPTGEEGHAVPEPTVASFGGTPSGEQLGGNLPSEAVFVGAEGEPDEALVDLGVSGLDRSAGSSARLPRGAARARRRRRGSGQRGGRASLAGDVDWRRAVVLSELLGPPVALRDADGGGALGSPPGLR